ncbi:hypothetical protein B0H17DRAFT_1215910 [Mycena rosella]|uniref:Uncharacterized protein n=1 Tax=Mycena rosella TaxID=1033263 RepID=A0AAD7FVL0_MYCRO|nr:hypothetical protein B0H17DRAFT_1215910 [Mycena rosella]
MPPKTKEPAPSFDSFCQRLTVAQVSNSLLDVRGKFPRGLRNAQVYSQLLGQNFVLYPKSKDIIHSLLDSHFYHILVAENTAPAILCAIMELDEDEWARLSRWVGEWFIRQDFEAAKREVWRAMLLGEARCEFPWIQQYQNGWPLEVDSSLLLSDIPRV